MKYSKRFNKEDRNELYAIYIYLGHNKIESFEKYCYSYFKLYVLNEKV